MFHGGEGRNSCTLASRYVKDNSDFFQNAFLYIQIIALLRYAPDMKISHQWLSDFITWKEHDPQVIATRLTAGTGEVEEVTVQGEQYLRCCVGKILTLAKHPNADRLSVCEVQTDLGKKQVVCGGTNLRQGMRVAFAHVGTTVTGADGKPLTLEVAKIRGEESHGMICAASELGLSDRFPPLPEHGNRPVIDLGDGDDGVGKPLASFLGLSDVIFHIDNHAITNRPDLFSHIGIARECVALGLASWKKPAKRIKPTFAKTPPPFSILLEQKNLVPRYFGCMLHISAHGTTPAWMRNRLEAAGCRSISLPIDITNYVMLECGTPLHCFDADDLRGTVRIRTSREGEKILTLDHVERTLPAGAPIISDDDGIFDLLGVMGGLRSSMKPTTQNLYLQSPVVDPVAIRTAIIGTGHRTDAATIFEKGVPPVMANQGFLRALELFLTLVPGTTITSKLVTWGTDGAPKPIKFSYRQAQQALGMPVAEKIAKKILADLGFSVGRGVVKPPLWRIKDCTGSHDLVEEIGRIIGYDRIPAVLPEAVVVPPPRDQRVHRLRGSLCSAGFLEVLPLSILSPQLLTKCRLQPSDALCIENALGEELSLMQTSTLPRLLEHAGRNLLLTEEVLRTFTCAHAFTQREGEWQECGILAVARREVPLSRTPFLIIRQFLVDELAGSGHVVEIRRSQKVPPFGHPGRSADILVGGIVVGLLCELHPEVSVAFDLPARAAVALLDLSTLLKQKLAPATFVPVPQFPSVTYDLTVTLDAAKKAADFLASVRRSSSLLTDVSVVDLYDGSPLAKGQYNLTVRCTYRASDRTLTEEEVKKEHAKVEKLVLA